MKFCKYRFTEGPSRGQTCDTPLIATCDTSKPSEPTEFKGQDWTKKKPQMMAMYPTAEEQGDLCFWHQRKNIRDKVGRET